MDFQEIPLSWSEQESVVWKTPIAGAGWSSPLIGDGLAWLTTATNNGTSLRVIAVDVESGQVRHDLEVFQLENPPAINTKNTYASPTGILEAGRLYVHFGTFGSACIDTKSASIIWTNRELVLDHKEGPGSSPVIAGDLFIVNCDGIDQQYVAALNKLNGELVWKTTRTGTLNANPDFRKAYSTPLLVKSQGQDLLVSTGADQVIAYDPQTGKEIWKARYDGFSNVPRPITAGHLVIICTGYMKPTLMALRTDGTEDVTQSHVEWIYRNNVPANASPVLVQGNVFMVSDQGVGTALEAESGKKVWQDRLGGNFTASLLATNDRVYFFSEEGEATVVEAASPFAVLAKNKLEGRILATPAAMPGALLIRTDSHLYRIGKSTSSPK